MTGATISGRAMKQPRCRVCGCTQDRACVGEDGPCWWVEEDLCSECATPAQLAIALLERRRAQLQAVMADPAYARRRLEIAALDRRVAAAIAIIGHCAAWQAERSAA